MSTTSEVRLVFTVDDVTGVDDDEDDDSDDDPLLARKFFHGRDSTFTKSVRAL